jgi:hypothetical protein
MNGVVTEMSSWQHIVKGVESLRDYCSGRYGELAGCWVDEFLEIHKPDGEMELDAAQERALRLLRIVTLLAYAENVERSKPNYAATVWRLVLEFDAQARLDKWFNSLELVTELGKL